MCILPGAHIRGRGVMHDAPACLSIAVIDSLSDQHHLSVSNLIQSPELDDIESGRQVFRLPGNPVCVCVNVGLSALQG